MDNLFPVIVFEGEEEFPSVFENPVIPVAPVTVMLEKLLFVCVNEAELGEDPAVFVHMTVPPAPVLLKPVTMLFPVILVLPDAGILKLWLINVKFPVVFVVRLVKVLLLIEVVKLVLAMVIAFMVADDVTEWLSCVKLLALILTMLVALADPEG